MTMLILLTILKISNRKSEAVNRGRTDNTIEKDKRTMIYKQYIEN